MRTKELDFLKSALMSNEEIRCDFLKITSSDCDVSCDFYFTEVNPFQAPSTAKMYDEYCLKIAKRRLKEI